METLTIKEAYMAMYEYLERLYDRTESDDLGGFLGSMSMLDDGGTADPAAWHDWLKAVAAIKEGRQSQKLDLK